MMSSDLFYISGQKLSRIIGYLLAVFSVALFMFAFAQSAHAAFWQINIDPDDAGSVTVNNGTCGTCISKTISGAGGSIEITPDGISALDGSTRVFKSGDPNNSNDLPDTLYFRATAASGQTFVNWSSTALGPNDNQANSLQPQSANGPIRTVTASFRQAGSTFRDQITVRLDPPFAGTVLIYGSSLPDPDPNTPNPTQVQNQYTFFYDASDSFRVVAQDGFTNDFVSWEFPWGTSTNLGVSFDNTSGLLDGRYGDFEIVAHYNSVDFCSDGIQNAGETGVDCGVVCFNTCPDNTGGTGGDGGAGTGGPGGTGGTGTFTPGRLANPLCGDPNSPDCVNNIPDFLKRLIEVVMVIGIPIVTLGIIYSGFLFVQAQGRPQKLTEAKNALLYSAIGGGILLGAWVIATAIGDTLSNFT